MSLHSLAAVNNSKICWISQAAVDIVDLTGNMTRESEEQDLCTPQSGSRHEPESDNAENSSREQDEGKCSSLPAAAVELLIE